MDDISLFTEDPAAMSCQRWHARWRASMDAATCFRSFSLMRRNQESRPTSSVPTHIAGASPPCRPLLPAQPSQGLTFPHTVSNVSTSILNDTHCPLTVIAGPDPRSPTPPEDYPPVVALRHREERSDPDED